MCLATRHPLRRISLLEISPGIESAKSCCTCTPTCAANTCHPCPHLLQSNRPAIARHGCRPQWESWDCPKLCRRVSMHKTSACLGLQRDIAMGVSLTALALVCSWGVLFEKPRQGSTFTRLSLYLTFTHHRHSSCGKAATANVSRHAAATWGCRQHCLGSAARIVRAKLCN